jgi:purine-binding chemotaxis protein CheW
VLEPLFALGVDWLLVNIWMKDLIQLLIFRLDDRRYALRLASVERVVRAAEITPLPHAPEIVLGVIDVGERVLPVLDTRRRFGLRSRELDPSDHFLIASTPQFPVALIIDDAVGVIERHEREIVEAESIVPGLERNQGVAKLDDGLVLIQNLAKFLSLEEARAVTAALHKEEAHVN